MTVLRDSSRHDRTSRLRACTFLASFTFFLAGCEPPQGRLMIRNGGDHVCQPQGHCYIDLKVAIDADKVCTVELPYYRIKARKSQKVVWRIVTSGYEFYEPLTKWPVNLKNNGNGFGNNKFSKGNPRDEYEWKSNPGKQVGVDIFYDIYVRKINSDECLVKDPVLVNSDN